MLLVILFSVIPLFQYMLMISTIVHLHLLSRLHTQLRIFLTTPSKNVLVVRTAVECAQHFLIVVPWNTILGIIQDTCSGFWSCVLGAVCVYPAKRALHGLRVFCAASDRRSSKVKLVDIVDFCNNILKMEEPTVKAKISISRHHLSNLTSSQLLYSSHRRASVLFDRPGSCGTPGHMVLFDGSYIDDEDVLHNLCKCHVQMACDPCEQSSHAGWKKTSFELRRIAIYSDGPKIRYVARRNCYIAVAIGWILIEHILQVMIMKIDFLKKKFSKHYNIIVVFPNTYYFVDSSN